MVPFYAVRPPATTGSRADPARGLPARLIALTRDGSWLSGGGRALIGWLVNSERSCGIILDEQPACARPAGDANFNLSSAGKPCDVTILAQATDEALVLGHEMIHAHHFMNDPWNERDRGATIECITEGKTDKVNAEEARTVGLGKYWGQRFNPTASRVITENMLRFELKQEPRLVY